MNQPTIWTRSGTEIPYPGVIQTNSTCVLVSLAGAINYLANTSLTEKNMTDAREALGSPPISFDTARQCVATELKQYGITAERFHDSENPLKSVGAVLDRLRDGAVLIPSFQVGELQVQDIQRTENWHMLSIFNLVDGTAQVWDSNNDSGFVTEDEIREFLIGNSRPIPYLPPPRFLLSHDQHEAILVQRPKGA